MAKENVDYARGYQAGRRYREKEIKALERRLERQLEIDEEKREERVYFECLKLVLQECGNWKQGDKPINNAERYSFLAGEFAKYAISKL